MDSVIIWLFFGVVALFVIVAVDLKRTQQQAKKERERFEDLVLQRRNRLQEPDKPQSREWGERHGRRFGAYAPTPAETPRSPDPVDFDYVGTSSINAWTATPSPSHHSNPCSDYGASSSSSDSGASPSSCD